MDIHSLITTAPVILNGQPVFAGTRVPIETLFNHPEVGVSLDEFLKTRAPSAGFVFLAPQQIPLPSLY